jgi:hypothetical protein
MIVPEIAVMVTIAMVIVFKPAMIAIPVTGEVLVSVMMRLNPMCTGIGGACPISLVPFIMASNRIPVTAYPHVAFAGTSRMKAFDAYRGRRSDSYSNGDLCEESSHS